MMWQAGERYTIPDPGITRSTELPVSGKISRNLSDVVCLTACNSSAFVKIKSGSTKSISDALLQLFDIGVELVSGANRGYRNNCNCDFDFVRLVPREREKVSRGNKRFKLCNVSPA